MWPEVATKKESVVSSGYFRKLEGNLLAAGPSLMARETTRGETEKAFHSIIFAGLGVNGGKFISEMHYFLSVLIVMAGESKKSDKRGL